MHEQRHAEAIATRLLRVDDAVNGGLELVEGVQGEHIANVDHQSSRRVGTINPFIVTTHDLQSRHSRRNHHGQKVDVGVGTRTLHVLVALKRRIVDNAQEVFTLDDPVLEEITLTPQMERERLQHHRREVLELRMQCQGRWTELRDLFGEQVPHWSARIVDVPELHPIWTLVADRDFDVRGREATLATFAGQFVLLALLQRHTFDEDLLSQAEAVLHQVDTDTVTRDRHEADVAENPPHLVGDRLITVCRTTTKLTHVEHRNGVHDSHSQCAIFQRVFENKINIYINKCQTKDWALF